MKHITEQKDSVLWHYRGKSPISVFFLIKFALENVHTLNNQHAQLYYTQSNSFQYENGIHPEYIISQR